MLWDAPGAFWDALGRSWSLLERSGTLLDPPGTLWDAPGASGDALGRSWSLLGRLQAAPSCGSYVLSALIRAASSKSCVLYRLILIIVRPIHVLLLLIVILDMSFRRKSCTLIVIC